MNKKPAKSASAAETEALIATLMTFGRFMRRLLSTCLPDSCSFMQLKTLEFVQDKGEPSMGDVAEEMKMSSPAVTMIINHLVESGELARVADPGDRRVVRLAITPAGKKSVERGMKLIREALKKRLECLTEADRAQMSSIMHNFMK